MQPAELPTRDEIDAAFEQGKVAVRALCERQATVIRDLEARIRELEDTPDPNEPSPDESSRSSCQDANPAHRVEERLVVNQGDIYWVQLEDMGGSEPGIRHPY